MNLGFFDVKVGRRGSAHWPTSPLPPLPPASPGGPQGAKLGKSYFLKKKNLCAPECWKCLFYFLSTVPLMVGHVILK